MRPSRVGGTPPHPTWTNHAVLTSPRSFSAAVGYFAKQGFTKEITFDRERWHGWIKDYDGGTLMECIINPKVDRAEGRGGESGLGSSGCLRGGSQGW